jgi:hypothetical protein
VSTLQTEMSIDAGSLRGHPTRRFIDSLTRTPIRLAETTSKIGVDSIDKALAAARPLATRDHSPRTRSVLDLFRSQRAALAHAAPTAGHPYQSSLAPGCIGSGWFQACWAGWSEAEKKTSTVPTVYSHNVDFVSTDEKRAVTFGSAAALGFHGTLPKYVCPAGPDLRANSGWAVAPACDAADAGVGFHYTGTLARLTYPARSVWAEVGSTEAVPGGLPVQVDLFDSAGARVLSTAVLVGSSTNGGSAWESKLVRLTTSLHDHAIAFVALYVNNAISPSEPRLAIDSLGYWEKAR